MQKMPDLKHEQLNSLLKSVRTAAEKLPSANTEDRRQFHDAIDALFAAISEAVKTGVVKFKADDQEGWIRLVGYVDGSGFLHYSNTRNSRYLFQGILLTAIDSLEFVEELKN